MTRHRMLAAGVLAAVAWTGGAAGPASAANVPAGFRISILAHVPEARELAVCGETLFVGTKRSSVYAIPLNGRGGARQVATGLAAPNGVACQNGRLYVAMRDRVSSWPVRPGGELAGPRVDVFTSLPDKAHHGLRYIRFGPDGRLYLSIGSPCNICQPQGLEGSIIRMGPDGSGRETVATGIRNSVGFDWSPGTGTLFFTDNGADGMGDNRPPDELNEVRQAGSWYGFPYLPLEPTPSPLLIPLGRSTRSA